MAASPQAATDFLVITALDEEREAVLAQLPSPKKLKPTADDDHYYDEAHVPVEGGSYHVVVFSVSGMGRVQAAISTTQALKRWKPACVLLVGIAGGIRRQGVAVGDVLIAEQVVDYELQKLKEPAQAPRFVVHQADKKVLNAAHHLERSWLPAARPGDGEPKVHFGPVASGDKVVALEEFLAELLVHWPRALGVEMEAGGVAPACFQAVERPRFGMVRGVSDLADAEKGNATTEAWRPYAREVAARYALALIKEATIVQVRGAAAAPAAAASPLRVETPFGIAITWRIGPHGDSDPIVSLQLRNKGDHTCDDVVVELRMPAGVAFFEKGTKPASHGVVRLRLGDVHPGSVVDLGHAARHFDIGAMYGSSHTKDSVEWIVTARDTPKAAGAIEVMTALKD